MSDTVHVNKQGKSKSKTHKAKNNQGRPITVCRTCGRCRAKKVKCDGNRPACNACVATNYNCIYPADERRSSRPTKTEIEALQLEVATLRNVFHGQRQGSTAQSPTLLNGDLYQNFPSSNNSPETGRVNGPAVDGLSRLNAIAHSLGSPAVRENQVTHGTSPSEADLACAIGEDGRIEVHGRTSHLHRESFSQGNSNGNNISEAEQDRRIQIMKDQLFAYAALQRQYEATTFNGFGKQLTRNIDLDGVPSEIATHLLSLHWNRQHFAYLLTYRPAIIDSLFHGGPYCNKLLLNAIYYSSCLYSDRPIFHPNPDDPESMGWDFYLRFKQHLMEEIDKPSLPTVAGLLICGATLVSNGKGSAGWSLCGLAYRMVIDLGCHLGVSHQRDLALDVSRPTATEIELRTRIFWGAFLTDKFQSLYLGRQPTLRASEARVSKVLLDYHEELENWMPYVDPLSTPGSTHIAGFAGPQPVYAISTFQSLIPLAEIASTIASTFYTMDSVNTPGHYLYKAKREVFAELQHWRDTLPDHLRFDPATDPTPPPNQITPHATYHTLIILLERPFLKNGHLSFAVDPSIQSQLNENCLSAALSIWRLIDAYKRAFTLRRAPYFLSYATYSAIVVMLHQNTDSQCPEYIEAVRFFWSALIDFQRGCTSGLRKPLKILQTLMQRLGREIPDWDPRERPTQPAIQSQDASNTQESHIMGFQPNSGPAQLFSDFDIPGLQNVLDPNVDMTQWEDTTWMDSMMSSQGLVDDSLFGLFTQVQPQGEGFDPNF